MTRLADWPITRKLALVTLVTSMTALLIGSLALGLYDRKSTRQATKERANQLASLIATTLESSLAGDDADTARDILDGLRSQRDIRAVAVYDADLQTFATFHTPLEGPAVVPVDNQSFFTDDLFVVYRTISRDTERIGTVQVEVDLTSMNMRMQQFIVPVSVLMLLLPWAAWFASKGLQGFVSGPILELVGTAREVSETKDYSTRAVKRSNDEVGLLIETFNEMLEQIQDRDDRLLGEGDRLEAEVAVRTQELRTANQRLDTARMAAVAASHAKSEFIANMSHEIRTPMNGVMGMAELLINTDLSTSQKRLARTVWESAEDLLAIINDILDFSKGEAGKLQLDCAPFDPEECIGRVIELLSGRAQLKGLQIVHDVDTDLPRLVLGDAKRLRQVLTNVVGNAIKFTERGDVVVRAAFVEHLEGSVKLRFEVIDGGIGIPSDVQGRIFDGFSQGDSSTTRKFGGTGLGLAISKNLVGLMGGTMGVVSKPGIGSNFWFTVQVERSLDDAATPDVRHASDLSALRILVADGSAGDRQLLNEWLDAWGCVCVVASTGEQALAKLHAAEAHGQPFDVALTDLHGPGMNSVQFARVLRADPTSQGLHLVLLTSSEEGTVALEGLGFDAAIAKPLKQPDLLARLVKVPYPAGGDENRVTRLTTCQDGPKIEGAKVLVAEDNPVNQEVAATMLTRLGCNVDVVPEGGAAVEAVRSRGTTTSCFSITRCLRSTGIRPFARYDVSKNGASSSATKQQLVQDAFQ